MLYLFLAIQTHACQLSEQSVCTYLSSTWKQVIDARMRTFRKRQTAVSSISSVTSTLPIASILAAILQNADCRRRGHTLPVHQWRKSFIIILKRLRQATFITVSALKRANISFLAPTVRRISTQKRTSLHCSGQSMRWQRSTICRCFIVATQEAANALPQTDSN